MAAETRRRLVIPTLLAVCALGAAPSCEDEPSDDTTAESSSASGTDTTISGEDECFDILEMDACVNEAAFECQWNEQAMVCLPNCAAYTEQSTCEGDDLCVWTGSNCTDGAI